LEVFDQRSAGLIRFACLVFDPLNDFAVVVPAFVIELDEAHAALDQPARQQAVHREGRLSRFHAI